MQAEKHLQIRQDAERRYMAMLERTCKMLADQFISATVIDPDTQKFQELGSRAPRGSSMLDPLGFYSLPLTDMTGLQIPKDKIAPSFQQPRTGCSVESCLTSPESLGGLALEGPAGGGKKRMMNLDPMAAMPLIWNEAKMRPQDINVAQGNNPHGITRYGM